MTSADPQKHPRTKFELISNNPRRSYCDFKVENFVAVRHLEFDRKLIFEILQPLGPNAAACQISTQSGNLRLIYGINDLGLANFKGGKPLDAS